MGVIGVARTRIGKVTLKGGGASLSILNNAKPSNGTMREIRKWLAEVAADKEGPPVAFIATAFWLNPDKPGSLGVSSSWYSDCWALPVVNLPEMALRHIRLEMTEVMVRRDLLSEFGYDSTPPDAS